MSVARYLRLVGATGDIRVAQFENREHIVVPVIALVEGVIHAMNAAAPEMVFASEFSKSPAGWNGRPVMPDHPIRNSMPVSANHPEVLEAERVGLIFGAKVVGKKLTMEAWIDVARATAVGPKGLSLLERAQSGKPIEVSVGVFVTSENAPGVHNGKQFFTVWREIVPDHLALLSEGSTGACSMEMGCGVRAAAKNQITEEGVIIVAEPVATTKSFRERVAEFFGFKVNEGVTANELHNLLWDALYASEPGFAGIDDILLDDSAVVYSTSPEQNGYKTFRRGYSKSDDGSVNLAEDRLEVRRKSSWEPVAAGSAPCGCVKDKNVTISEETKTMTVEKQAERIKALCESKKNHFTEEHHGAFLRTLGENDLKALEDIDAKMPEPKAETKTETPAPAVAPVTTPKTEPVTLESYIASAPKEIQDALNASIRAAKAEKDALIAQLKTAKNNPFTDEQLNAKTADELRQLVALSGVQVQQTETSFALRGASRPETKKDDANDGPDAAPTFESLLAAQKK